MIIIQSGDVYKIISSYDLNLYKHPDKFKIIGQLNGDYPSLQSLEIKKKNVKEFISYLDEKIKEHNRLIKSYKIQLKAFKGDLSVLGVQK